jgi:signal transduction histidine kinase
VPSLRRALAGIAILGVLVGAIVAIGVLASDHVKLRGLNASLALLIGWSFLGAGLYAWWRRPYNRFGGLMAAVAFAWFLSILTASNSSVGFTIGLIFGVLYLAVLIHMLLAYPSGRLETGRQVALVCFGYVLAIAGQIPPLLWGDSAYFECPKCPVPLTHVSDDADMVNAFDVAFMCVAAVAIGLVLVILIQRWRQASPPQRRAMAPVLWSGFVLLTLFVGLLAMSAMGASGAADVLAYAALIAFTAVPWAFLFGLLRSRFSRAGAVSELLTRIGAAPGTGGLRELLADALGDRSLRIAYWLDAKGRWIDPDGHEVELPSDDHPRRAWTSVELEGRRVGAVVYDRSLCEEPELVASVAAAAALAVQHEQLTAELRARVEELRASRQRLVEAGIAERRRLERNLHDGAQQRLVALSLTLRLAQNKMRKDPDAAERLMAGAHEELQLALEELRELARGIHPAVLSDRGLQGALEALAGRLPIPIELSEAPDDRLPAPIEAAAYFVVAEALTNVVKYADASHASVTVVRSNGHAIVEVRDDGIGGADPGRGSGLRGLADRVAALDGRLELESPPGEGTLLRAEIPV